jgi:hypothetical protein
MTFCVGMFGLDRWHQVGRTVAQLAPALDRMGDVAQGAAAQTSGWP